MATLKRLTQGYYAQAAQLVKDTDEDAALALYLTRPSRCWSCVIFSAIPAC
ncbi:hypothetical protein [Streptomyces sp. C8S0]|uniref:hypothetical protein n=1 Tax=Streptomyces sp. C8S0 TaxID=2585716 RepID=UPI001D03816C|nr:hypothetical protein [Streptomyces sp. C8S0]